MYSKAVVAAAAKTHGIDLNFMRNVCVKISIHAAKRSLKPISVILVLMACFWFYLLLHQTSKLWSAASNSMSFPKESSYSKQHPKLWEILKKISNKHNSNKDVAVNNSKSAKAKEHNDMKADERNHNAIPLKNVGEIKKLKFNRFIHGKQSNKKTSQNKNYPKYYEDNLHPDWMFKISRTYDEKFLRHWTEPNRTVPKLPQWAQGENGHGFVAKNDDDAAALEKLEDEHNYNLYASDRMSLHRSLPDYRYDECKKLIYPDLLPTVSVIIVMHNEAWPTILRTIWSIIDRSPHELLHEILIVDDASTWDFLKRPFDDYVDVLPVRVRVLRTNKREGLIRARLIGAKNATGSILTFFDAHMECTEGWLQPIAARIANDRSVVAVPIIDGISSADMSYGAAYKTVITGLRWHLIFNWIDIPKRELTRTKHDRTAPIRTPSHVGCAFAIDREFFFEIGSYDVGMDIWGAENVEMAFRVWMCGGSLEILPCSRVGHLYRISTYSFDGDQSKITRRNTNRLVEVWMDEFKEFFYVANPSSKDVSPGDLTARKELRKQLKCKNFRWYLEHIYSESTWLMEYTHMGEILSGSMDMCLDIDTTALNGKLVLWPCHGLGGNQFFAFEKSGLIVTVEEICVGVNFRKEVILVRCSKTDKTKLWTFDKKQQWIVHRESGLCMHAREKTVILAKCNATDARSQWTFRSKGSSNMLLTNITKNS